MGVSPIAGRGQEWGFKDFSLNSIYELLTQPYPIIQQLALDVIKRLVMYNGEEDVQESFRNSGGVQNLLDMLDHAEWDDLHGKVLCILNLACDNTKTAKLMNNTDGTKRLFSFMEVTEKDELKLKSLSILVNLSESTEGKKLLHSRGLIEYLFKYSTNYVEPAVQAVICRGIAKMVRFSPAADEIAQNNPSEYILSLLNNEKAVWKDRQIAVFTLKELFTSDFQNCINFLDSGGQTHLMRIISQPMDTVPVEIRVTIIQAIAKIADYPSLAQDLTNYELISTLCTPFEEDWGATDEVKIACCEALSRLPINEEARKLLVHCNVLGKLYPLLTDDGSVPVRCAAANLLLLLCTDPLLATLAVHEGYLFYMLKNQSSSSVISTWNACIKALFRADLPMKFAYTGRLSLNDVTEDGFYVMRRLSCPFPVLEELFRLKLCPLEPIYVANFSDPRDTDEDEYLESKQVAFNAAREAMRRESMRKGLRVSEGTINAWLELKFGRLQRDPDLQHYLNLFRVELQIAEDTQDCGCEIGDGDAAVLSKCGQMITRVSRISNRARILGRFVARQLSGTSGPTSGSCVEQQLELHLRAIKTSIETSVIPLGMLRLGSYLERALLFKLIADRIGLPASLVRGRYGKSWIEIAVPTIASVACSVAGDDSQLSSSPRSSCSLTGSSCRCSGASLPTNYLRENFIVDLMHEPGELILIGSTKALKYCDGSPKCEFSCCDYRD
ncbi:hypothetical protein QAD02_022871 [Eretmocerus hayati]|uniref:Uncharacterized protein n=1 Tax=Eretmocerus hayati TaxID=131215 RepID=A0ACC2PUK1_9HYME|nr:hypothetical protein QAD02_022871 [Eretmocerus hayati]